MGVKSSTEATACASAAVILLMFGWGNSVVTGQYTA
jgi:hypothetical protein